MDYELPLLKKTITAPDGTEEEDMLQWVARLANNNGRAWKVMEKNLSASDVSYLHNRFMISKQIFEEKIEPMMEIEEIEQANLNNGERLRGLEVMVYDNSGRDRSLYLVRCPSSVSPVIKGKKYIDFMKRSYLFAGNLVEMWAFRDGANKLCFFIGKKLNLELFL